ncbi:MAG: hypothetical protein ACR2LQ_03065 [Acidimicrobiales bacterium]
MSFDDHIRESLDAAARAHDPETPPADLLGANVVRRQRRKFAVAGVASAAAALLLVGVVVALPDRSGPKASVHAVGQPGDASNGVDASSGTETRPVAVSSTTAASTSTSLAVPGTIAPNRSVVSPPATVISPTPTTQTTQPATTTMPVSSGDTVTVTQDDNGKTYTLQPGQHLVVSLTAPGWTWSAPDTDNAKALARTAVSANPSADHVTASFDAKTTGEAHVSASKDAACRQSSPPCMVPTYLWQITVNVT